MAQIIQMRWSFIGFVIHKIKTNHSCQHLSKSKPFENKANNHQKKMKTSQKVCGWIMVQCILISSFSHDIIRSSVTISFVNTLISNSGLTSLRQTFDKFLHAQTSFVMRTWSLAEGMTLFVGEIG